MRDRISKDRSLLYKIPKNFKPK